METITVDNFPGNCDLVIYIKRILYTIQGTFETRINKTKIDYHKGCRGGVERPGVGKGEGTNKITGQTNYSFLAKLFLFPFS